MATVNSKLINSIEKIKTVIEEYIENKMEVCIHLHGKDKTIRNLVIINQLNIDEEVLHIEAGNYEVQIESSLEDLKYIEDENSVYIRFINSDEIYLEPVEYI